MGTSKPKILEALRTPDKKRTEEYRKQLRWSLERAFGEDKSLHIDSVELFSVYKFVLSMTGLGRRLEQRAGGGQGSGVKNILDENIWTIAKEGKSGDFSVAIPGSTTEETCHKCHGTTECRHCGGSGKSDCRECHGSGKCDECGGSGLQTCPSCRGSGKVKTSVWVTCSFCHGTGRQWGGPNDGADCPQCHGRGQEEKPAYKTCPNCGGDGKTTCKACGGKKKCGICEGTGKTECRECSGSGKCKECGGTGKTNYSWWCIQEELTSSHEKYMEDKADEIKTAHTWGSYDVEEGRKKDISTACDIETDGSEFELDLIDKRYPDPCVVPKGDNEDDAISVSETFSGMWQSLRMKLRSRAKSGKKTDFKVVSQRYKIERIPVVAKYTFSMFGKKGVLLEDLTMSCSWDGDLRSIEREYWRRDARRTWVKCDLWFAATLAISAAVAATPFVIGAKGISTCFETVASPALVIGVGAFISIRFLSWYFYSYVWDLIERESRTRAYEEFGVSVKSVDHKIWLSGRDDNARRVLRLLWVLVPLVLVQGLYAKVPQVAQFLQPAKEWFAAISSTEWSYIAGVCALKVAIIWASRKWEWKFAVEKSVIVLLAVLALAFAIWPSHLPDGMALKSGMDQVLPYVALPIRFLGLAVYWPVCIALWALGFAGRMAVSLVLWIISLFM